MSSHAAATEPTPEGQCPIVTITLDRAGRLIGTTSAGGADLRVVYAERPEDRGDPIKVDADAFRRSARQAVAAALQDRMNGPKPEAQQEKKGSSWIGALRDFWRWVWSR